MLAKTSNYLPIIVCLSLFSTAQATDDKSFYLTPPWTLSPDEKKLAITVYSDEMRSCNILFIDEAVPFLMPITSQHDGILMGAAWRPSDTNSTLSLITAPEDDRAKMFEYQISEAGFRILEKVPLKKDCVFVSPAWNDDGTILAMRMTEPFANRYGHLVFSYDNGRTIIPTDFNIGGGNLVWKGRSTIFIQDANYVIYEIKITGTTVQLEKKRAFGRGVHLAGRLGGQPIYFKQNEIRRVENNDLLYTAKDPVIGPYANDDGYIVFSVRDSNEKILLNDQGKELYRRIIDGKKQFITFVEKQQALYFLDENMQVIKKYNFADQTTSTVYNITAHSITSKNNK
jgi:hypothetical protein